MTRILCLALALAVGCKGTTGAVIVGDDDDLIGDDDDTTLITSDFGLESRPANPGCVAPDRPPSSAQADVQRVYSGVSFDDAVWLGQDPAVPGYWYVAEQDGYVRRFVDDPGVSSDTLVINLSGPVARDSEAGLLGMAFHPNFANNGEIFLSYTASGSPYTSRISRFTSPDGGATLDPGSEEILLSLDQPFTNHNGGNIVFGPDGYLYIGFGDGGSGGDPGNRAQNTNELLGKILRIDVDSGNPYGIPADNPFADGAGGRAEIYAVGMRNPWRFSFDSQTGELWVGDVGQNAWEEVDKVERGGNYGWRITEGKHCYDPPVNCNIAGLLPPLVEYPSSGSTVIGGVVYYGSAIPELRGTFLFMEYYDRDVLGVRYDPVTGDPAIANVVPGTGRTFAHFATGLDGEVYLLERTSGVYQLVRTDTAQVDTFPQKLSETGCFASDDPATPVSGVLPYSINHPFWSDGAEKDRFFAIPDGTTIGIDTDGDWDFPVGTVTAKHFRVDGDLVETRLFVRHDDGDWAGYAYEWNAAGTDADLLPGGKLLPLGSQDWSVPSRSDCLQCHGTGPGGTLGPENRQMNTAQTYPTTGLTANQIDTLDHIGMFTVSPGDSGGIDRLEPVDGSGSVEDRARAYLHANCSICHRPDGNGRGNLDLQITTAIADMDACDVNPSFGDLGLGNAKIIAPGNAAGSVLSARMHTRDAYAMPPLGSNEVDTVGAQLIDDWINSLSGCN